MRVMVIVKASKESEAGKMPSEQLLREMGQFNEQLVKAGVMKAGDGLRPSADGVRVHFSGQERTVTAGPFAETHELIAGYWIWEVASMEEAIEWAKRCPNPMEEAGQLEIRPFYDMEDFAESDPTGEIARDEEEMRMELALHDSTLQPYLFFGGRCEEALAFYKRALGANVTMTLRFDESPEPIPDEMQSPDYEKKIMHSEMTIGGQSILASDGCGNEATMQGFSLLIAAPDRHAVQKAFDALAEEGQIQMPLGQTFFSSCFGQVTDRFGVSWMLMVDDKRGQSTRDADETAAATT